MVFRHYDKVEKACLCILKDLDEIYRENYKSTLYESHQRKRAIIAYVNSRGSGEPLHLPEPMPLQKHAYSNLVRMLPPKMKTFR